MRVVPLDKLLSAGNYTVEDNKGYVIRQAGSDQSGGNLLKIDRADALFIKSDYAPLYASEFNILGPIDLRDDFLVIPPGYTFELDAGTMRIVGELYILEPGESMPDDLMSRFNAQKNRRIEVIDSTYTVSGGSTWAADQEITVYSKTNPVAQKNTFNHLIMGYDPDPQGIAEDQIGVTIYYNDTPLDISVSKMGPYGLTLKAMPLPPRNAEILEEIEESFSTDGSTKNFSISKTGLLRHWLGFETDYTTNACVIRPKDKNTVYAAEIPDPSTAGNNQPDSPIPSGNTVYGRYAYAKYPEAPSKVDLAEHPITQNPGDRLEVKFRNESGSDYSPSADQTFRVILISVFERVTG